MIRDFCNNQWDEEQRLQLPPEVPEAEWQVSDDDPMFTDTGPLQLDLQESGITNVLWACGWAPDMTWLQIDQTSRDFEPRTKLPSGIVSQEHPGLYFAGFPWIGTIQSMNILNMDADAKVILQDMLVRQQRK